MDRKKKKVLSIEDPVEYEGDGISQIDVNKNQITFSEALRSSLRLDPDVIMVGEIRDKETAELAMKAASTGHLVFSTLHTNGAIEAIGRLQGMGIPSDILEENIELVSALTLRKKLCPECRVIRKNFSDEEVLEFSSLIGQGVELFEASGRSCGKPGCFNGVIGRQLITESIGREAVSAKIRGEIVPGYRTLKECAKEYACLGVISSKDVVGL